MLDNIVVVDKDKIQEEANNMKLYGYRLVSISCVKDGELFEFIYHFDLNYKLKNLKMSVTGKEPIKSISTVYPAAFLVENEYQDLYGFTFEDLTIDYKGNLYLAQNAKKAPLLDSKE